MIENHKSYEEYEQIEEEIYKEIAKTGKIPVEYEESDDPNIHSCIISSILIAMCPDIETIKGDQQNIQFLQPDIFPFIKYLDSQNIGIKNLALVAIAHASNRYDANKEIIQEIFVKAASDKNRFVRRQCAGALMLISDERMHHYANTTIQVLNILTKSESLEQRKYSARILEKYWDEINTSEEIFELMVNDNNEKVRKEWIQLMPNLLRKNSLKEVFQKYSKSKSKEINTALITILGFNRGVVLKDKGMRKYLLESISTQEDMQIYNSALFSSGQIFSPLDIEYSRSILKGSCSSNNKIRKVTEIAMQLDWLEPMKRLFLDKKTHNQALAILNLLVEDDDPDIRKEAKSIIEYFIKIFEENKNFTI